MSKYIPTISFARNYFLGEKRLVKGTFEHVHRHLKDKYVKQKIVDDYRCRSAYKLLQIDAIHKILRPGLVVIDVGAAPGSWSQVLQKQILKDKKDAKHGKIIAIDLLRFPPIQGVDIIQGDFTSKDVQNQVVSLLKNGNSSFFKVDLVVCDAAPKPSGIKAVDHDNIVKIVGSVAGFAMKNLKPGGNLLFKLWDGDLTKKLQAFLSQHFATIEHIKPDASRKDSAEFFILCKSYKRKK